MVNIGYSWFHPYGLRLIRVQSPVLNITLPNNIAKYHPYKTRSLFFATLLKGIKRIGTYFIVIIIVFVVLIYWPNTEAMGSS